MTCISAAITEKIISNPSDELSVVLYSTEQQKGDFPGVVVLRDFDKPSAGLVEQVEELKSKYGFGHWETAHPNDEFPLCDAFWTASALLGRIKVTDRRVFLFTDEDCPHQNEDLIQRAKARLDDYHNGGVEVSLFAFDRPGRDFRLEHFYHAIRGIDDDGKWKAHNRLELMLEKTMKKVMKKRSQASLKFTLGEGVEFSVKLFTMLREADKMSHVWLDPATMYPVKPRTKWLCSDTGSILRAAQMKKYFPYGTSKVVFDNDELKRLKFLYPPGITLLGFKSLDKIKEYHNLQHASFLFPDDSSTKGSTVLFKTLLEKCLAKRKCMIVRFVPRSNSQARLAALIPDREVWEDDMQIQPSGFHVILLPWADEIRKLEVKQDFEEASPNEEQVIAAKKMVHTLTTEYDPHDFENPGLQKHFAVLQTYALSKDDVLAKFKDNLEPDAEGMEFFKDTITDWKKECVSEDYAQNVKKEKAATKKRVAREIEGYAGDFAHLVSSDKNARMITVPQIKQKLKEYGVTPGKLKSELWEQLKTCVQNDPNLAAAAGGDDEDEGPAKRIKKEKTKIKKEKYLSEEEEF
jgi:ATP-dependent DNA helicase 2 subunit 1